MQKIQLNIISSVIYILDISNLNPDRAEVRNVMPLERFKKMRRYINFSDRARHLGNELLFYYGLKEKYNIEEPINRNIDKNGKPFLSTQKNIHFNMSHSGKYSVCAFSSDSIGVDIEEIQNFQPDIVQRFFNETEYKILLNNPHKRMELFYQFWVLKESFIKAIGVGFQLPLGEFTFSIVDNMESRNMNNSFKLYNVDHQVNMHKYVSLLVGFDDYNYKLAICKKVP